MKYLISLLTFFILAGCEFPPEEILHVNDTARELSEVRGLRDVACMPKTFSIASYYCYGKTDKELLIGFTCRVDMTDPSKVHCRFPNSYDD